MNLGNFKGAAKRIDDIDIPRIGAQIGVGEDELHAFMDVEAAGSGFDGQGRPKMLFEPHVFYRNLKGEKRDRAVREGLAYPKWRRNYPADSYPRLRAAITIDETAALKASSWGAGQILGENYAAAGYASPREMVAAFMDDEENHVQAMVNFLESKGLARKLREHDWAGVARGYNGAGYKANAYDRKMAEAFAKWKKIRDTAWVPGDPPSAKPVETVKPSPAPVPQSPPAAKPEAKRGILAVLFEIIGRLLMRKS